MGASLFGKATNSAYLVNASVMHKINFFCEPDVRKGPNKSAWILWLGSVGCGSEVTSSGCGFESFFRNWHLWQC